MSERTRRLPAYAVPMLLISVSLVMLWLALKPTDLPRPANQPVVVQSGKQANSGKPPTPIPTARDEQIGTRASLPGPVLTPYDNVESSYRGYNLLVPGQPVTYSISAYNESSAPAYNLVITDHLPISLTNASCIEQPGYTCAIKDGQAIYSFATPVMNTPWKTGSPMPANIWAFAMLRAELATAVPNGSNVSDKVEIGYTNKAGTPQPTIIISNTSPAFVPPNVPMTISTGQTAVQRGQLITYTISFTNAESIALGHIWLQDKLGVGLQYVNCFTGPSGGYSRTCDYSFDSNYIYSNTVMFFNSSNYQPISLSPGESKVVTVTAMVKLDAADGTVVTNTVEVHAPVVVARATATNIVQLPNQPLILLNSREYGYGGNAMIIYAAAYPNQPIRERIPYRNVGGAAAYDLRLIDTLPRGFVADACDAGAGSRCTAQGGQAVYTVTNPFAANASGVLTVTMHPTISAARGITLSSTLVADYRDTAGKAYQAADTLQRYVVITPTTMTISQDDGQTKVQPGQLVTYTITVTNSGPLTTDMFYVADILPPGLSYVSCSIEPGSKMGVYCGEEKANEIVPQPHIGLSQNDQGPNIAPGQSVTMTVTARVDCAAAAGASLTNKATLYYNGSYTGVPAEDTDTVAGSPIGCTGK